MATGTNAQLLALSGKRNPYPGGSRRGSGRCVCGSAARRRRSRCRHLADRGSGEEPARDHEGQQDLQELAPGTDRVSMNTAMGQPGSCRPIVSASRSRDPPQPVKFRAPGLTCRLRTSSDCSRWLLTESGARDPDASAIQPRADGVPVHRLQQRAVDDAAAPRGRGSQGLRLQAAREHRNHHDLRR